MSKTELVLQNLIDAAMPFTSGDIVDETTGTTLLMEKLDDAINEAKCLLYDVKLFDRALTECEIRRQHELLAF